MPVEILEIVVRANVQEQGNTPAATPASGNTTDSGTDRQQLIEECVEQVLEILRHQTER